MTDEVPVFADVAEAAAGDVEQGRLQATRLPLQFTRKE